MRILQIHWACMQEFLPTKSRTHSKYKITGIIIRSLSSVTLVQWSLPLAFAKYPSSQPLLTGTIHLPHSHARVNLVYHQFKDQVVSLLTDGWITDDDYLFHNDNPFEPPPEAWTHVSDINTGLAYRETYKKLIKDPTKDVQLPLLFYMDGAITGQFDHLPVEALKFTLAIFNGTARDCKYTWKELGYICDFLTVDTEKKDWLLIHANDWIQSC